MGGSDVKNIVRACKLESFDENALGGDGRNGVPDPCLEKNPIRPIPLPAVYAIGGAIKFDDLKHVTWYADDGFHGSLSKYGSLVFNAYDYFIAVGDDLRDKFPPGSLVTLTYMGKSVVARVIDRKPCDEKISKNNKKISCHSSLDLSKAVAYALGGYKLLQKGVVEPVHLQRVELNCDSKYFNPEVTSWNETKAHYLSTCLPLNHHLTLARHFLKTIKNGQPIPKDPPPETYSDIIALYSKLLPFISLLKYSGEETLTPHLEMVAVYQNRPSAKNQKIYDTDVYVELRLVGIGEFEVSYWMEVLNMEAQYGLEKWQEWIKDEKGRIIHMENINKPPEKIMFKPKPKKKQPNKKGPVKFANR